MHDFLQKGLNRLQILCIPGSKMNCRRSTLVMYYYPTTNSSCVLQNYSVQHPQDWVYRRPCCWCSTKQREKDTLLSGFQTCMLFIRHPNTQRLLLCSSNNASLKLLLIDLGNNLGHHWGFSANFNRTWNYQAASQAQWLCGAHFGRHEEEECKPPAQRSTTTHS